ncbi:MAG: Fic family protein [Candidatus Dormibacteraeota bacterium]|nr:Fic family protein [Candidatus Dormibacteraeota bacterium]
MGRLDGVGTLLPDPDLLLYFYVRKEAVLSSQIEGTQSSLSELLLFESEEWLAAADADVREVSNYVDALYHGLGELRNGFPLSMRLIRDMHRILLASGRGSDKDPGEFRRSQNWLGGTRPANAVFVPPPHQDLPGLLSDLERFLHDEPRRTPVLLKAALAHAQFETIHPFLDGNGRMGRLLITLLLCAEKAMVKPLLFLSLHFKQNRHAYYDLLQSVREDGEWEAWVAFFLEGVEAMADQGTDTARKVLDLVQVDRRRIQQKHGSAGSLIRVHDLLQRQPLLSIPAAAKSLRLSQPTVSACFARLTDLGVVRELTGMTRNRRFSYQAYFDLLAEGTEPIPA